ncbi:major facilitator superfamily protein [Coniochaeta sp. 2T2.1]|nr:major facilitator superfamily protein [Coniochaeta sp. 2T2.1]
MATVTRPTVVPGTVHLVDVGEQQANPLNWSDYRKRMSAAMVVVYTTGVGLPFTLQYSVLADITADTGISTAALMQGAGLMFLFLGLGCLFWQPIALTYGRRDVYLISALATVPLMVWTAYSKNEGEWYAHRIILGFFCAPIEALPEVSIPDVFFAHDRGAWMSLYVFALFGSNFLAPLVAGWFALAYGWVWTMCFGAIVAAVTFVILFFFMEETMYFRRTLEGLEHESPEQEITSAHAAPIPITEPEKSDAVSPTISAGDDGVSFPASRTYLQGLSFYIKMEGRPGNKAMFKAMLRPLAMIVLFPNVAWAGFIYGINLSRYNVLNGTASPVMSAAPYNWSSGLVGTLYAGPIIGAALGCLWAGVVADKITLWLARRNNGVREPEQRLWPLLLTSVLSCVGLITWGVGAAHGIHWAGFAIGLGILTFSVVAGGSVALSYNIDCFKDMSGIPRRRSSSSGTSWASPFRTVSPRGIRTWDCRTASSWLDSCRLVARLLFFIMIWKGKDFRRMSADRYWRYAAMSNSFAKLE